jgi:hypothetical protein
MYGSGVMIGMMAIIIKTVPGIIPRDPNLEIVTFCVVVLGTTTTSNAVLLSALGTLASTATTTTDFVFLGLLNGLIFFLLHFYTLCKRKYFKNKKIILYYGCKSNSLDSRIDQLVSACCE